MSRPTTSRRLARLLLSTSLALAAASATMATPAAAAAPSLPECPTVIREYDHPFYGPGWLMNCADGPALVIPSRWHTWAINYATGAAITGVATRVPPWLAAMERGEVEPGPVLARGEVVP